MTAPDDAGFLSRWARRKADAQRGIERPPPATVPAAAGARAPAAAPAAPGGAAPLTVARTAPAAAPAPAAPPPAAPTLDDVAGLTRESDYGRFVAGDVEPGVRNAAMKKLFSDPHFNVMDGLDVYIDDYGKPDPLPPGMLRQLAQSRCLGLFDDEQAADPAPASGSTPATPGTPTDPPDEDPDLRLQPDDAAGPERHRPHRPGPGEDPAGQP